TPTPPRHYPLPLHDALPIYSKHLQHTLPVDSDRFERHAVFEAKGWRGLRLRTRKPEQLVGFETSERVPHHVLNRMHESLAGPSRMDPGSQERMAQPEATDNGRGGHPDAHARLREVLAPHILRQVVAGELPGEPELRPNRLADVATIDAADHRREEVLDEQSVELVPVIDGRHEIKLFLVNGPHQRFNPF